jgi:hypothetical protein
MRAYDELQIARWVAVPRDILRVSCFVAMTTDVILLPRCSLSTLYKTTWSFLLPVLCSVNFLHLCFWSKYAAPLFTISFIHSFFEWYSNWPFPNCMLSSTKVYPKVSGLVAWSKNYKCYSSLPLGVVVSIFHEFCRHNPLCCFSTSVCCCCCSFRYRLSPETFGYIYILYMSRNKVRLPQV